MGHLMAQPGLHRNEPTGELVAQNVQICTVCFRNFASDDAADKHWDRKKPRFEQCLIPEEVGLISSLDSRGSTIYRVKR